MNKVLWIRKLSCGHERPTNLAYMSGIYKRPRKGQNCFCRECCQNVDIISVKKASGELTKVVQEITTKFIGKKSSGEMK